MRVCEFHNQCSLLHIFSITALLSCHISVFYLLHSLNLDPLKNPYAPKPTPEESVLLPLQQPQDLYGRK